MMLAAEAPPTITLERWACAGLPKGLCRTLIEFARSTGPACDPGHYLETRFDCYPEVRIACGRRGIEAFALLHPFSLEDERYLYVGPVFSRGRAYVHLFGCLVRELLASHDPFHVAAEIEHPAVLHSFAVLLPSCMEADDQPVSLGARRVARRFQSEIPHIEGLELTHLRTRVNEPLFEVTDRRRGSAQLVLVSCDGSTSDRRSLAAELRTGLTLLGRSS
jgi:hypothetical protein